MPCVSDYAPLFKLADVLDAPVTVPGTTFPLCSGTLDFDNSDPSVTVDFCSLALDDPAPLYAIPSGVPVHITGFVNHSGSSNVRLAVSSDLGPWAAVTINGDGDYVFGGSGSTPVAGMTLTVTAGDPAFPLDAGHNTFTYSIEYGGEGWDYRDSLGPSIRTVAKMLTASTGGPPGAGWEARGFDDSGWADPLGMPAWVLGGFFSGRFFWPSRFPATTGESGWIRLTMQTSHADQEAEVGHPFAYLTVTELAFFCQLYLPGYRIVEAYWNGTPVDVGTPLDTPFETQYSADFPTTVMDSGATQVLALRVEFPSPAGRIITVGNEYTGTPMDPYRKGMQAGAYLEVTIFGDTCTAVGGGVQYVLG